MNDVPHNTVNTRQFNRLKEMVTRLTILCVLLTIIVIVNLFFTIKLVVAPAVPQPTEEAFLSGSAIPANVKHNGLALGEDNAPVTVEMFSDFQCPFCKQSDSTVIPQLINQYVATGKVKFIYRPFSFLGQESLDAAQSAYCANEQGKFWEFKEILFANQKSENTGGFVQTRLLAIGKFVGLDMTQFTACVQSNKYAAQVQKDNQAAAGRNVHSTPSFFVNGLLVNNGDNLFQPIEAALK
jgi:protein-disulfide isomerase